MGIKITNISAKIIGVGNVTVLPGETKAVPPEYENSNIVGEYKAMGLITIEGKASAKASEEKQAVKAEADSDSKAKAAAAAKKAKLDGLKSASDEDVAAMAKEHGINPAECKDLADVRKKVKAALSR